MKKRLLITILVTASMAAGLVAAYAPVSSAQDSRYSREDMARSEDLADEGLELYKRGEYEKAREALKEALITYPDNKRARRYFDKVNDDIDKVRFRRLRSPEPEEGGNAARSDELYKEGVKLYRAGDYQDAWGKFKQALIENPSNKQAAGYFERTNEKIEEANAGLAEEIRREREKQEERVRHDTAELLIGEGDRLKEEGDYEAARMKYREAAAYDPGNSRAEKALDEAEREIAKQKETEKAKEAAPAEKVRRDVEKPAVKERPAVKKETPAVKTAGKAKPDTQVEEKKAAGREKGIIESVVAGIGGIGRGFIDRLTQKRAKRRQEKLEQEARNRKEREARRQEELKKREEERARKAALEAQKAKEREEKRQAELKKREEERARKAALEAQRAKEREARRQAELKKKEEERARREALKIQKEKEREEKRQAELKKREEERAQREALKIQKEKEREAKRQAKLKKSAKEKAEKEAREALRQEELRKKAEKKAQKDEARRKKKEEQDSKRQAELVEKAKLMARENKVAQKESKSLAQKIQDKLRQKAEAIKQWKERLPWLMHKKELEKKSWGFFGVRDKGVEALLDNVPVNGIPEAGLSLDDCIDIALKNNLELEVAIKQINAAKLRLMEAKRNLLPTLKIKWEESTGKTGGRHYYGKKILGEYKQPIFHGGELIYTVGQNAINVEILKNDYDKTRNGIILTVTKAYYSLDRSVKALGIQKKILDIAKELNDMTKRGYDMSAVTKLEYLNMASKYNQQEFQHVSAEEDVELARLVLQQSMNTEDNVEIQAVGDPEIKDDISLDECYELAFANRPEMKTQFLMTEYYLYEKKIKKALDQPKVDLLGSWGHSVEDYVALDHYDGGGAELPEHKFGPEWYVGIKASVPFAGNKLEYSYTKERWQPNVSSFTHGSEAQTNSMAVDILSGLGVYGDIAEADVSFVRAQQEYYRTKQQISVEVQETYFRYKKSLLQMELAKSKIEYQRRQLDYVKAQREIGQGTPSGELDEQMRMGEEEYSAVQSKTDYCTAVKSLNNAIGIIDYFPVEEAEAGDAKGDRYGRK
ncbi:MAG: TolC family protein [Candidatus Omnitrophota bacterium]